MVCMGQSHLRGDADTPTAQAPLPYTVTNHCSMNSRASEPWSTSPRPKSSLGALSAGVQPHRLPAWAGVLAALPRPSSSSGTQMVGGAKARQPAISAPKPQSSTRLRGWVGFPSCSSAFPTAPCFYLANAGTGWQQHLNPAKSKGS